MRIFRDVGWTTALAGLHVDGSPVTTAALAPPWTPT
jgi:hypothetical protein